MISSKTTVNIPILRGKADGLTYEHRIKKFPMRYSSNRDANVGFEKL